LYDHQKKLAWFHNADFVLRVLLAPGLLIVLWAVSYFLYSSDMTEVSAVVTGVTPKCTVTRIEWRGLSLRSRKTETRPIDCGLLGTPTARDLEKQGYRLVASSVIEFDYKSPVNNQRFKGVGEVEDNELAVGDTIRIDASRTWVSATEVKW